MGETLCAFLKMSMTKIREAHKKLMGFSYQVQVESGNYANDLGLETLVTILPRLIWKRESMKGFYVKED